MDGHVLTIELVEHGKRVYVLKNGDLTSVLGPGVAGMIDCLTVDILRVIERYPKHKALRCPGDVVPGPNTSGVVDNHS